MGALENRENPVPSFSISKPSEKLHILDSWKVFGKGKSGEGDMWKTWDNLQSDCYGVNPAEGNEGSADE